MRAIDAAMSDSIQDNLRRVQDRIGSAAIAAGLSPFGLGTDLAISVRGPAAHTGIVSLKPTHGRIPMTGVWPRAPRRDWHVGPMARTIRDLALTYPLLAGPDGLDVV